MKNKRAIILLFAANIISGLAQGLSMIAIPWYFATIIDRSDLYSLAFAIISFITLFWSLYAGTLIDKYPRKNIFIAANIVPFVVLAFVACYGQVTGAVEIWMALGVMGITILFYNVHYPAIYAFNQELVEPKYYGKINSWLEAQGQSTNIIAGALAAILLSGTSDLDYDLPFEIERWELYEIFTMDAATYIVAIFLVSRIKYVPQVERKIGTGRVLDRLKEGISYLKENTSILIFGLTTHAIFAFIIVEFYQLVPNFVDKFMQEGADVFALAEILYSVGALVAGVAFGSFIKTDKAVKRIIYFFVIIIVFCFALGFNNSIWLFVLANFVFWPYQCRNTHFENHLPAQKSTQ